MTSMLPNEQLVREIERSEVDYMYDRISAIESRLGNPEGIELKTIGHALCLYSKTMPWPAFNTVKGITGHDVELIDDILKFYRARDRKPQFEIVPASVDERLLLCLAEKGLYQSGFHASLYTDPASHQYIEQDHIHIQQLQEDQFELYATIHCRGTGLSDDGIPYVAENNKVLYHRPGWKFYIAYVKNEPAAVGVMYMKDGIGSLTFAATLPQFRNQGLQQQLLRRRIEEANQNSLFTHLF